MKSFPRNIKKKKKEREAKIKFYFNNCYLYSVFCCDVRSENQYFSGDASFNKIKCSINLAGIK